MYDGLNIPLTGSAITRRDSGRVAALVGGIVFGLCIGVFAFRAQFTFSRTIGTAPDGATTLHILKTHGNFTTLNAHIGNKAIFPGAPWTIRTLFAASEREMTIAILANGEMAYVIDAPLSNDMQKTATAFGIQAVVSNGTTFIAPNDVTIGSRGLTFTPSSLSPWHEGEIRDGERKGALVLNDQGVTLKHMGIAIETAQPIITSGSVVTAYLTTVPNGIAIPTAFHPLMTSPINKILSLFTENGGTLLLTHDELGDGYVLTTTPGDLTSEELAAMGKDIINRSSLSTQVWTLDDGSIYQEIVGASDSLFVDIRAEEDFTYVSLKDTVGNTLRMTKAPDSLTIANREITITGGEEAQSSCIGNAHSWISLNDFTQSATATAINTDATSVFINFFSEIAISNSKVRLCW